MRRGLVIALGAACILGCTAGDVDLGGKECPCATGWYCDRPSRTCRPGLPPDDAGPDDAGPDDAGPGDAGGIDAARNDGGRDAGPRDASSTDAGTDGGGGADGGSDAGPGDTQCDDVHAGAIFCDGLEAEGFAAWSNTAMTDGFIGRATDETFLGAGSMYAQSDAASGRALARYVFPTRYGSGDELFVRGWIYIPSDVSIAGGFTFLQLSELGSPFHHLSLSVSSSDSLNLFFNSEGAAENLFGGTVPRDAWFCAEARVLLHDTSGEVEYWLDDVPQGMMSAMDTLPAGGYERLLAGIVFSSPTQPSARVYLDEIVVDTSRIGCD